MYRDLVQKALVQSRADFLSYQEERAGDIERCSKLLQAVCNDDELRKRLESFEDPGAIPSADITDGSFVKPFSATWRNHEEARAWAKKVLESRTTFAADGSQLYLNKETSLPVGAVQIGWFENPHDPQRKYDKGARFEVLTPRDLLRTGEEVLNPESRIGEVRFRAEVRRLEQFIESKQGWERRNERMPVAFLDGTLLVSFSLPQTKLQQGFLEELRRLVLLSAEHRVPVVGYVDRSLARDVVRMVSLIGNQDLETALYDATMLAPHSSNNHGMMQDWGDRSVFCYSKRKGLESFLEEGTRKPLVGFVYLMTAGGSVPARMDVPSWVFEAGFLDEVIDVVRAECVIGLGYPYALETADATAVITSRDREAIISMIAEFAEREGLEFKVSRKAASKARRR